MVDTLWWRKINPNFFFSGHHLKDITLRILSSLYKVRGSHDNNLSCRIHYSLCLPCSESNRAAQKDRPHSLLFCRLKQRICLPTSLWVKATSNHAPAVFLPFRIVILTTSDANENLLHFFVTEAKFGPKISMIGRKTSGKPAQKFCAYSESEARLRYSVKKEFNGWKPNHFHQRAILQMKI